MLELFATFISKFFTVLKTIIGTLFARVMASAGLSFVTYKAVLPEVKAYISSYIMQLPEAAIQMVGVLGVDIAMIMVVSALVVRVGSKAMLQSVVPPTTP